MIPFNCSAKLTRAKDMHICSWCRQIINSGEDYFAYRYKPSGQAQLYARFHRECYLQASDEGPMEFCGKEARPRPEPLTPLIREEKTKRVPNLENSYRVGVTLSASQYKRLKEISDREGVSMSYKVVTLLRDKI